MPPFDLSLWQGEIEAIASALLHFVWQGALILLVYAAARRAWRSDPRARLRAGHAALIALAVAPAVTLALRWPLPEPTAATGAQAIAATQGVGALVDAGQAEWMPWLVVLWALGVLLLAGRAGWQWHSLRMICARARPLESSWQQTMRSLGQRFGLERPIAVLESSEIGAPSLIGWIKPVVLLPAGLCLRLPTAQVELVLAHEIAHLRRYDHLVNLLQVMVETLLFYHPAVHWISRRVREDREQCCDDLVADVCHARIDYARALLAIAEQRSTLPRLAIAAGGGQLLARVERIVGSERQRPQPLNERLVLVLVAGLTVLLGLQVWPGAERALPLPASVSLLDFDASRVPTPVLGLRLAELAPRRAPAELQPLHAGAATASPAEQTLAAPVSEPSQDPSPPLALPAASAPAWIAPPPSLAIEPPPPLTAETPTLPLAAPNIAGPGPRPLRMEQPVYPRRAEIAGIEGAVELSFVIDARGRVTDVRVELEQPAGSFAQAAERALRRWRFAPTDAGPMRQLQTFDFRLEEPRHECVRPSTGSRICRPQS
jgi:bla regulator protein blaR1